MIKKKKKIQFRQCNFGTDIIECEFAIVVGRPMKLTFPECAKLLLLDKKI